ncbi:MGMT family protein [Pontibacillus salicampi]|uniref:MGMT family protein n=1 Tax=Pontibacillus salicampi TaxID=1449801 RepID=A0ABV6LNG4_9BACI
MKPFTAEVIRIIQQIPKGKVMAYGQIAKFAGNPKAARQVVRVLHSMGEKYQLPWHRVINSKGEIGITDEEAFQEQKLTLQEEGVDFLNDKRIDMAQYQYWPERENDI